MSHPRLIRQRIWERLKDVARPDTRFHMRFSEFIPDFEGSDSATDRLAALPSFARTSLAFVTPDNSMLELRRRMIVSGTPFVMSTYNIQRGFLYLAPGIVPKGTELQAAWLDGIEHYGRPVTLEDLTHIGRFDFMATGASAVSMDGVRFGKGHTFFDLEWGMFTDLGLADEATTIAAVVHDVQVVEDRLNVSETEIPVDFIATPTRTIAVERNRRRPRGIRWSSITTDEIDAIPPLKELARMRGVA
ncbi:5-formyltetrahydrofolate cyclo-ligase [Sinorhizobium sp. BG8]|uniref:5-formyltetrahydrofolate cyclo-ligase n=1 Tax=Sinorhizobium sp. BG8 TaxID=2613773 RepID=UPI00193D558A|nr:5-formyltetrahydrofolate cyclo-ligase [Sinorhizobium sp. BG8]QRM53195.1 5-formyltetrahydrofolate cyclo-ligase [Sinorhizobium sp. BG8]